MSAPKGWYEWSTLKKVKEREKRERREMMPDVCGLHCMAFIGWDGRVSGIGVAGNGMNEIPAAVLCFLDQVYQC